MKKLRTIILSFALLAGFALPTLAPVAVYADDQPTGGLGGSAAGGTTSSSSCSSPADCIQGGVGEVSKGQKQPTLQEGIKTIVGILLFVLGAIAVIMIIIGGIRYTTSNGDANQTKAAKDTVLYAVVGLIVALLAYAIVNFVLDTFVK